ncbi:MAG TPA: tRNA pseudouridine(55) synthase TruB, partial [Clostridia bacterium]|nr:tRNA pseudouridine(55) synthase TruB [Clostridia bacterium]
MWGKINLYKEADMSSQQAVTRLRRLLGIKKIGHSGTLDPMATGVLNCFVSQATKFIDLLPEEVKVYQADFILGQTSDTLDIWGNITSKPFVSPTERELKEELGKFIGESFQIPPMYSAIKYKGQALYHYARQGIEIPRKKRKININKLELINFDGKKGSIRIHCSRGTYIRTLIDDLGQNLGTGAIMSGLVREHNDWAGLKDCYSLKEIEA